MYYSLSCWLMANVTLCCSLKRCSSLIFSASSLPFFISIWASLSFRTSVRSRAPWKYKWPLVRKFCDIISGRSRGVLPFFLDQTEAWRAQKIFVGFNLLHEMSWLYLFGSTEGSWLVQWLLFFSVLGAWLPQCQSLLFLPVDKKDGFLNDVKHLLKSLCLHRGPLEMYSITSKL